MNRILSIRVRDHVLTPMTAEMHVLVRVEPRTQSTRLRGRLMGPVCHFAGTVEVAYPLRALASPASPEPEEVVARVIVPEPSLWDLQSPFLYSGPVELWQDDRLCASTTVRHGLRTVRLGPSGVRINGKPVAVRGKYVPEALTVDEALALRAAGYNLLVAPVREATVPIWNVADRIGFLVIGKVDEVNADVAARIAALGWHPSTAGWLARAEELPDETIVTPDTLAALGPID